MKKILTFLVLASVLLTPSFAWFSDDYNSRIPITVAGNVIVAVLDTQTLISNSKMNADCSDIRVTNTTDSNYTYWVQSCDTDRTKVYAKTINPAETNHFIYYGFSGATDETDFNSTFSNALIPNGDFEGDADGVNPDTWTIAEPVGSVDVSQARAFTGIKSTEYIDNSGANQPTMKRGFSGLSYDTLFEFSMNIDSIGGTGPFVRVGGNLGDFDILSMQFKIDNGIDLFTSLGAFTLNISFSQDEWTNVSMVNNFTELATMFWINGQYAGNYSFRQNAGAPSNMDDVGFQAGGPSITTYYVDGVRLFAFSTFAAVGPEERRGIDFTSSPEFPHVEENVTFTCSACGDHNMFWWDFGAGSDLLYLTTNATVGHIYGSGGIYNVTLFATNSTGSNETASNLVTVFEPEVSVWAQEDVSGDYVSNFDLVVENETKSFNFSASGFFALWNYTDGPTGDVNITLTKAGFNHTTEAFYVSNSTNNNFTLTVETAIVIVFPKDIDYPELSIPAVVELRNETVVSTSHASWELFDSFTIEYKGDSTVNDGSNLTGVGQMFEYRIACNTPTFEGGSATSKIYIYDSSGGNQQEIDSVVCTPSPDSSDETRIFYLSKDGTYKILETDGTPHDTGNFPFFPARAQINSTITRTGVSSIAYTTTQELYEIQPAHGFFLGESGVATGTVEISVLQDTSGNFGFLQNTYANLFFGLQNLAPTIKRNLTAFMIPTSDALEVKFTVVDRSENALEGAFIEAYVNLNGTWYLGTSGFTDGTGILKINLKSDGRYQLIVSSGSFEPRTISVNNPEAAYKFYMEIGFEFFTSPLSGLFISLIPTDTNLNRGESTTFNYTVVDSQANLSYWGLTLFDENFSVIFSQRETNPSGGFISHAYTPVNESYIFANMTFKRISNAEFNLTRQYTVWNFTVNQTSFTSIIPDLRQEMGPKAWSVFIIFLTIILSAFSPWFAVLGLFALAIAGGLNMYVAVAALMGVFALLLRGLG